MLIFQESIPVWVVESIEEVYQNKMPLIPYTSKLQSRNANMRDIFDEWMNLLTITSRMK